MSHFQRHILFHRIHAWYISLNINQHETSKSTNVPCRRTSPQNLPCFSQGWVVEELPTFPFGDWNHVEDDTETSLSAPLVAPSVSPKDASNTGGLPVSHTDVKNRGGLTMVNPTGSSPWPLGHAWNSRRPYVFVAEKNAWKSRRFQKRTSRRRELACDMTYHMIFFLMHHHYQKWRLMINVDVEYIQW